MAENTVDTLKIRVAVDTGNSTRDLGKVVGAIDRINKVASDRSLDKYSKNMKSLANAARGLNALPSALSKLENISISPKLKDNLDKIASAGEKLASVGKGIKAFSDSLSKITKMGSDTELDKKFDAVATSVGKFANNINNAVSDETLARLERLAETLEKITKNANKKVRGGLINQTADSNKAVNAAILWKSIENAIQKINVLASDIGRGLFSIFDGAGITHDIESMTGAISKNIPVLGELTSAWRSYASEVRKIVTSNAGIIDKAADLMIAKVTHLVSVLYGFVKMPFKNIGLTKGLTSLLSLPFQKFADSLKDLSKTWSRFTSSLARIAIYRGIRTALKEIASAIKEGVNNLYLWAEAWKETYSTAERFASSMDTLASGVLYLKNAVGAMVSPLIDYLAPAIDALIDKFVELTNVINQAIAALTGASLWRKAMRYPIEYGDVMSGAKKKADDLKRTVLGFDELNRLDDNKKKSGGGAKDDWDYSKMFEEMAVSDRIRNLINADDWSDIGNIIAGKINQALASIDWASIQNTVKKWAKRFGSLFNATLLGISMPLLGKSIAEFINTIADGINTFFDEFDFEEFGNHLARGFESFVHNSRWKDWGKALTQNIKMLINTLYGFKDVDLNGLGDGIVSMIEGMLENIDLAKLGNAVATLVPKIGREIGVALNGLFRNTNNALGGVNFTELGEAFAEGLNNLFSQIDATEAGKFLTASLSAIIDTVGGAVSKLDWDTLNTKIGDTITAMFENIDLDSAVGSAMTIAENIVNLLTTAVNSIPWEKVGNAIASVDTTELKNGIKRLFEAVVDGLEKSGFLDEITGGIAAFIGLKIGGAILKIIPSILPAITAAMGASSGASAGASVGAGAGATGGLLSTLFPVSAAITIGSMLGQQLSHHIIAPILEGMGSADAELYRTWTFFGKGGLFDEMMAFSKMKVDDFKDKLREFGSTHASVFDKMTDGTTTLTDVFGIMHGVVTLDADEIRTSLDSMKERFSTVAQAWQAEHPLITGAFNTIKETAIDSMDWVKDKMEGVLTYTLDTFAPGWRDTWDDLSTTFSNIWNGIGEAAKGGVNIVVTAINGLFDKVSGTVNSFVDGINNIVGNETIAGALTGGAMAYLKDINLPHINLLASGGMVNQGSMFIAGEAGPELVTSWGNSSAVMNVDQIVEAIAQGVAMANGGDITIPIILDGNMLDQVIVTAQQRQNVRSGGR